MALRKVSWNASYSLKLNAGARKEHHICGAEEFRADAFFLDYHAHVAGKRDDSVSRNTSQNSAPGRGIECFSFYDKDVVYGSLRKKTMRIQKKGFIAPSFFCLQKSEKSVRIVSAYFCPKINRRRVKPPGVNYFHGHRAIWRRIFPLPRKNHYCQFCADDIDAHFCLRVKSHWANVSGRYCVCLHDIFNGVGKLFFIHTQVHGKNRGRIEEPVQMFLQAEYRGACALLSGAMRPLRKIFCAGFICSLRNRAFYPIR